MEGEYLRLFVRVNADDLTAKHGVDAEAVALGHAKACLKGGNMEALKVNLEVLREIRRRSSKAARIHG